MIETPSGKGAGDENFPVGSWLLEKRLRPHVAIYYAFARAIDDIADNPELSPDEKLTRLDHFADALERIEVRTQDLAKAVRLRESLAECGVPARHGLDLISAFKQDAVKQRYETWAELMDYCDRSASPVGRYLLDLHGEDRSLWRHSDALCNALQVINHLQDCQDDYRKMNRVYLPQELLREFRSDVSDLDAAQASAGLRQTLDRALSLTDGLMAEAAPLPMRLKSLRLALESGVIFEIARDLITELRRRDPLAERVELSKPQLVLAAVKGIFRTLASRLFSGPKAP
jgi:squalene synthase HpnC